MEQVRFSQSLEPTTVEVAGCGVKLYFSLRAAARMEAYFGKPYLDVALDMLQAPDDEGKPRPGLDAKGQAAIVAILMQEAGQTIGADELLNLHVQDFSTLALAAQAEILGKMPTDAKKKALASLLIGIGQELSGAAKRS